MRKNLDLNAENEINEITICNQREISYGVSNKSTVSSIIVTNRNLKSFKSSLMQSVNKSTPHVSVRVESSVN